MYAATQAIVWLQTLHSLQEDDKALLANAVCPSTVRPQCQIPSTMVLGFYCRGKVLRATVDPSTNSNIATQTHNSLALYRETVAGFKVHPVEGLELQVRPCNLIIG